MNAVLRLCRFFSTLLAYLLFGVVGCSLALILPVLLRFCPPDGGACLVGLSRLDALDWYFPRAMAWT